MGEDKGHGINDSKGYGIAEYWHARSCSGLLQTFCVHVDVRVREVLWFRLDPRVVIDERDGPAVP